jgi:hypothetical protein
MIRAVRDNNPGNIRIGAAWQGLQPYAQMTPDQQAEKEFCVFQSPRWGFRAMATILHTYQKHGLVTLREIISRWAPTNENDTAAYLKRVVDMTHLNPDAAFAYADQMVMRSTIRAMSVVEVGSWAFSLGDLSDGVSLAR